MLSVWRRKPAWWRIRTARTPRSLNQSSGRVTRTSVLRVGGLDHGSIALPLAEIRVDGNEPFSVSGEFADPALECRKLSFENSPSARVLILIFASTGYLNDVSPDRDVS